jgi:hypothetical protein
MCLDHRQSERRRCQHASDHVRTPLRKAKKISCVENTVARRQGINQYHSQGDVTQSSPTLPQPPPPFTRKYKKEGGRPESSSKQTPAWRGREKTSTLTIIKRLGGVGWGSSPVNQVAPSGGLVGGAVATTHLRRTPKAYNDDDDEWNQHGSWTCVCVPVCEGIQKKRGADGSSPHITHVHTETHTRGREEGTRFRSWTPPRPKFCFTPMCVPFHSVFSFHHFSNSSSSPLLNGVAGNKHQSS